MKKKIASIITLIMSLLFIHTTNAKIRNEIVIKVENEIITSYEIKNKILTSLTLAGNVINQENINNLKPQAVESLIQQKLKKIELKKYKIKKNSERINSYLNTISGNNISELKARFEINNLDYELFLKEVEIQTKWQNLIYLIYSNKIEIDENLIDKDIKKIIDNEKKMIEFKISEIEISLENDLEKKDQILNIQNKIKKEGFGSAAVKYSVSSSANNKGDLGWISSKSLSKQILNIIKKMKIGQISEPIIRQNSLIFLKLNDVRSSDIKSVNMNQLKKRLIEQKKNELFNLYSKSHLSKLKNTSLIEYR